MIDRDSPGAPAPPSQSPPSDRPSNPGSTTSPSVPPSTPPASGSSSPPSREDDAKRVLPELIRKVVEAGIERLAEGPENVRQRLGDLRLPKDALASLLTQLDEGKAGLYRALAKELRDFLESTNFSEEFVAALTKLSFEIKTEVRLIPNDAGRPRPNVKSNVKVRQHRDSQPSPSDDNREEPNDPRNKNE